jgi:alkylated DNA repair dioxygenase AlkB
MKESPLQDNYLVLKHFISAEKAKELAVEFQNHLNLTMSLGDRQVPKSQAYYNYLPALELLCEKTPEISAAIGETVLPTYTYGRVYKKKATLAPHTDLNICEVSLSLHLNGDAQWPIYIEDSQQHPVAIHLDPGDAVLYLGCEAKHWREEFNGVTYAQFFLHYVKSRGKNSQYYFDKII